MEVFEQALRQRFFFRNPELQARNDLRNLKQGSMPLPQCIIFEDCHSYQPRPMWDDESNSPQIYQVI